MDDLVKKTYEKTKASVEQQIAYQKEHGQDSSVSEQVLKQLNETYETYAKELGGN